MRSIVAVLALLASGCASEGSPPAPPLSSVSVDASTTPERLHWSDGLPTGKPPRLGYVVGHTLHRTDGTTVDLPHPRDIGISWITRFGDGFIALDDRYFEGSVGMFRADGDGDLIRSRSAGMQSGFMSTAAPPTISSDGRTLTWVTFTPPETGFIEPIQRHTGDRRTGEITSVEITLDDFLVYQEESRGTPWLTGEYAVEPSGDLLLVVTRGREAAIVRHRIYTDRMELATPWIAAGEYPSITFETP